MSKKQNNEGQGFEAYSQKEIEEAESSLRERLIEFSSRQDIQAQIGEAFYIWKNDPELLEEDLEGYLTDVTFTQFFDWFLYDFRLLDTKKRLIETFIEGVKGELSPLEKSILESWEESYQSYYEVEEVADKTLRLRELFTGNEVSVEDVSTSKQVKPRDIVAARAINLFGKPYFAGVVYVYPGTFKPLILEFFEQELAIYKNTRGSNSTPKDYLKEWGFAIGHYVEGLIRNHLFVNSEGEELSISIVSYRVKDTERAVGKLRSIGMLREFSTGNEDFFLFSWVDENRERIIGTIEVEKDILSLQCYSPSLLSKGKEILEDNIGELVEYLRESQKPLKSFVPKGGAKKRRVKLPPGVKSKKEMDDALDEYYKRWVDLPNTALGGKTPRQCAQSAEDRKKLILVLKELSAFYERSRQRGEPYYDVGKLIKDLGLEKI
jgi:hypothetical protein